MNIAFVNSTHKWGGVKTWILDFGLALKDNDNIFVYGRQNEFVKKARELGLYSKKINFGPDYNPLSTLAFYKEFKKHKISHVFVNVGKDLKTAGFACKFLNANLIQQIGLPKDIKYSKHIQIIHKFLNPKFLASCEYIKEGFLNSLPYVEPEQVKVILTAKKPRESVKKKNQPLSIVTTSQLMADKGHSTILKALSSINDDFIYHIVGTGPLESKLKRESKILGLKNKVIWHGFTRDVNSILEECDLFVLPSLVEGLPNTVQEAMAQGLITISRDVGGVGEIWPKNYNHFLLPYGANEIEFKTAIENVLSLSDEEIMKIKKVFLETCKEKFDIEKKSRELHDWLLSL